MSDSIETWLDSRGADKPGFQTLLRRKRNSTVVSYAAAVRSLEDIGLDRETSSHLQESYRVARVLEPSSLAIGFKHPSMQYWNKTTQRLIPYLRDRKPIPEAFAEHLRGVLMRGDDVARMHVIDINRFIIAAAIVAKEDVSLPCPVHDGWVSLPGIGISIASPGDSIAQVSVEHASVPAIRCGNAAPIQLPASLQLHDDVEALQSNKGVRVLKRVSGSQGTLFLDTMDPYFKSVWLTQAFPGNVKVGQVVDPELSGWQSTIADSLQLLRDIWPESESEITAAVHSVVPVTSPIEGMNFSCSQEDFWGAILCTYDPPPVLAEVLVHEYGHNLLYALMEVYGVFAEDSPKEAVFYSPWRPDPRPLSGILHAVFVFERVAEMYRRLLQVQPGNGSFRERYSVILARLDRGLQILEQSAVFNSVGEKLYAAIHRGVRRQHESECAVTSAAAEFALEQHLAEWKCRHSHLAGPVFTEC